MVDSDGVDVSESLFSNKWSHPDITAIIKDHLCVSQLPWFYQRPYYLSFFRFIFTLREIWILTLNATIRRHNDVILRHCSNNSYPEAVNDEYIVVFNFAGRRMSGFEVIVAGGGDLVAPTPPPMAGT